MAGGVTCSGKAFVSQCAPEAPIGVTFRQKVLRYQRTAYFVLNRATTPVRGSSGVPRGRAWDGDKSQGRYAVFSAKLDEICRRHAVSG